MIECTIISLLGGHTMHQYRKLYIDGALRDAANGKRLDVFCPATDEKIGEVASAGAEDSNAALESAKRALPLWSTMPIRKRVDYMMRLRKLISENEELLRVAEMDEHGKTYEQTEIGYTSLLESLDYYAQEIQRLNGYLLADSNCDYEHRIVYRSAGVAGAFIAWNFPLVNLAYKLGPAMAAGCPIIIRPSSETPISAYIVGELCAAAGLPPGVVNILTGPVSETADVITKSKIPAVLTLIGSSETGLRVMENGASSVKRYSMELGGNAPMLVFPDADIDLAASIISAMKFPHAGQNCVAPNRIFVHESIHDAFVAKVVAHAQAVKIGFGRNSGATMGPIINKKSRDRIDAWVKEAVLQGAKLLYGGKIPDEFADRGSYYMPTVLDNVTDSMQVSSCEIFGPVVGILTFRDYNEVIARANATDAGLASYVVSNDVATIQNASRDLDFGEVQVNGIKYTIDLPHMGIKQSGIGQDCSSFALEDYMVKKRITTSILAKKS